MYFEILGDISEVETFATGSGTVKLPDCEESMDAVAGANARESRVFDWLTARSISPKCTGTKPLVSDARNSR